MSQSSSESFRPARRSSSSRACWAMASSNAGCKRGRNPLANHVEPDGDVRVGGDEAASFHACSPGDRFGWACSPDPARLEQATILITMISRVQPERGAMPGVLDGIKVLDLSWGIAGPVTGMLLADHGADVVKIEPPGGDPFRGTPGYATWLRGRRSIELDLKADGDRTVLHDLAGTADVVIESWAPGTAARLGADATTLLRLNPGLIVCSLSAYGDHPAHRDRPGYDALVAARLGSSTNSGDIWPAPSGTCTARGRSSSTWRSPRAWRPERRGPDRSSPTPPG